MVFLGIVSVLTLANVGILLAAIATARHARETAERVEGIVYLYRGR